MSKEQVIAIDFDGTIIEDYHWPEMGPVLPGAADCLRTLANDYTLVIHSCRTAPVMPDGSARSSADIAKELKAIHDVLVSMGLGWIEIWQKPWKPPADLYIDNRAYWYYVWNDGVARDISWRMQDIEAEKNGHRQLVLF